MSDFKSLISPRSRVPIVYTGDSEDDEENINIGNDRPNSQMSLALGSHPSSSLPMTSTLPTSILKARGVGGGISGMSAAGDLCDGRGGGGDNMLSRTSAVQNRLEEEASAYKRRLESYRQAQHQQALLVARLQSKLLQYRQRCTDLESKLGQSPGQELYFGSPMGVGPGTSEFGGRGGGGGGGGGIVGGGGGSNIAPTPMNDLDDALWKLEQERIRNENLMHLNNNLRGELDETRNINDALSNDLQKLSDDWEKLTRQMIEREQLWKAEEQAYSDYYANEHSKLLNLWKKVSSTKRDFAEMKSSTGRDMAQLKNTIARMSNQISSGVITATVASPSPQQEAQQASFIAQLTQEIQSSQMTHENLRKQLKDRDDKIQLLEGNIITHEDKILSIEGELNRLTSQDLLLLNNCLKEVAKLLLNDFDQHGLDDPHELHLTSTPTLFIFDENSDSPTIFAESVVSGVQAALNKRQLQVHQLQVNLSSAKEQSHVARAHVESLESDMSKAEEKIIQLTQLNEKLNDSIEKLKMEKDSSQRGLEHLKNEKNILEQQRRTLASELDSTLKIKNNMGTSLTKLEKSMEQNREEMDSLMIELDKIRDELMSALSQLKLEQDLNTRIREQLTTVGDDKDKNMSENKSLKTQLNELVTKYEDITFQYERSEDSLKKWKMDAEILTEKFKCGNERTDILEKEKKNYIDKIRQLESIKGQLDSDLLDARNDLTSLRREMLESERLRTDLESKIEKLISQVDVSDNRKSILETQIDVQREEYLREMSLMNERIEIINEELNHTRKEYDETQQILDRTKLDLINQEKLHMEAIHSCETKDNIIKELTNTYEKIREDKQSLEELEHNLKTTLLDKNKKIESYERTIHELKIKMNTDTTNYKDKLNRIENDIKTQKEKYENEKSANEMKYIKEMTALKSNSSSTEDKLKNEYEDKYKILRVELETDKRNEVSKLTNEINSIRLQIDSLRVQYEEALLRAENDKQQGLLLAQQDQQGLSDKIRLLERELDDLKNEKERIKRECEIKCTHEKSITGTIRSELIKIKNELETTKQDHLDTKNQIENRLNDIERERELALLHVEELRNKLRSTEERENDIKKEMNELIRRNKDTESTGDHVRKELNETRRSLTELNVEKEKNLIANEQLKEELNRRETDLLLLKKELIKTQNNYKNLERIKIELESEYSALNIKYDSSCRDKMDVIRNLDEMNEIYTTSKNHVSKLEMELNEMKLKLESELERKDDAEGQLRNTKKMLEESENKLNMIKSDEERLSIKLSETEERFQHRESQLLHFADENKQREKKLMEEKHNLNVCLMSLQQQMDQLTAKLSMAENRVRSLTEEKVDLERQKKESNSKLSQIQSGFKRLGFAPDAMDNSEAARRVMATLQTQMAALQQDRDTSAAQLSHVKDALTAAENCKTNLEDQLNQLSRNLQSSRGDTKGKDTIIFNIEKDLSLKNNELNRMADKIREMEDNIKGRDDMLRVGRTERDVLKDELDKTRGKLDENRIAMETKWSKAEVQIRSLEGDLNRMSIVLQQKDGHIQGLDDKCVGMQRNVLELEERCASLTMTVEQLNISMEKITQGESDWKDKYNAISKNSTENSVQVNTLNEKLRNIQREKLQLEQERNNLNEKWEASSQGLNDFKRQVQVLAEKNQKLRQQTEEMTRNAIDRQLKATFAESGKEDLRQILADKMELQRKVDSLLDRIRDVERENRELERFKESSIPMKGTSGRSSTIPLVRDNAVAVLEEENTDLRRKISKMEAEIRDLERRHVKHIGEVTVQVKQERDFELERARAGKLQAERLLEAREGNYRQQIQRLEQQVGHLKEQLGEEIRRRQSFLSRSSRTGQEIRSLRQALGDSLRNVSMDPNTMENETRKLDNTLDHHKSLSQASLLSPLRDPSPGASLGGMRSNISTLK